MLQPLSPIHNNTSYTAKVKAKAKSSSGSGAQGIRLDHASVTVKSKSESSIMEYLEKTHPKAASIVIESVEWR